MPRPLPIRGQVWADLKENNTGSVQKEPTHQVTVPPINLWCPQPSVLKGLHHPNNPPGPQVRPELGYSQPPASVSSRTEWR